MKEHTAQQERIRMTLQAREQADVVLHRLVMDERLSEQRFAESGKRDPIKDLTGTSALQRAIGSTRQMIEHLDELLVELRTEKPEPNGEIEISTTSDVLEAVAAS